MSFLGLLFNLKKQIQSIYQQVQTSCFTTFGSSPFQENFYNKSFPTLPNKFARTKVKLKITSTNVKQSNKSNKRLFYNKVVRNIT